MSELIVSTVVLYQPSTTQNVKTAHTEIPQSRENVGWRSVDFMSGIIFVYGKVKTAGIGQILNNKSTHPDRLCK